MRTFVTLFVAAVVAVGTVFLAPVAPEAQTSQSGLRNVVLEPVPSGSTTDSPCESRT